MLLFSPRTRGCSLRLYKDDGPSRVFPAHAGMFRNRETLPLRPRRFPRARGDVPTGLRDYSTVNTFSPRTRGCSHRPNTTNSIEQVFPAHAGMFREHVHGGFNRLRFPRARGDVPQQRATESRGHRFSPRTRGCSEDSCLTDHLTPVFPAHAGMFLFQSLYLPTTACFPRARGDVPIAGFMSPMR